jgi:hypothetical protein
MDLDNILDVPTWVKIVFILILVVPLTTGGIRYFFKDKLINAVRLLPEDQKEKFIYSHSRTLQIYKILFWMMPITLVVLLGSYYFYKLSILLVLVLLDVLSLVYVMEDFLFRRSLVAKIKVSREKI